MKRTSLKQTTLYVERMIYFLLLLVNYAIKTKNSQIELLKNNSICEFIVN